MAKTRPLLATPLTVTTTGPVVANAGTATTIVRSLQLVGVAATPLKVTVLVPRVAPKLTPEMVTDVPAGPAVGVRLLMVGAVLVSVAHLTAASKSAPPLAVKLAAVVSDMNRAMRRAGASSPGIIAPAS